MRSHEKMSAMRYEDFKYRAENVVKLNKDKTAMRYLLENKKGRYYKFFFW